MVKSRKLRCEKEMQAGNVKDFEKRELDRDILKV